MTLQESFGSITDKRVKRCRKHNLVDILMTFIYRDVMWS